MSYRNCIINGIKEGLISEKQAQKQLELLEDLERTYKGQGLDPTESSIKAAKLAYEKIKIELAEKRRLVLKQKKVQEKIMFRLRQYRNINGEEDFAKASRSLYAFDNLSTEISIERATQLELSKAHSLLTKVLHAFKYKLGGRRSKDQTTGMGLLIREAFAEDTGNKTAKELFEAWRQTAEHLRKRYNQFGGRIVSKIESNWGLPQIHDTLLVRQISKNEWIEYVLPKLNIEKMIDDKTGLPFNRTTIRLALDEVYENISTEGMATFKPSSVSYGRSLANRRTDHRFLIFKSADDWMTYQQRFGNGDPFKTMMEHINGMARDIAIMKILGPNPDATHTWIKQLLKQKATLDARKEAQGTFKRKKLIKARTEEDRTKVIVDRIENLYAYHKGTLHKPIDGFFGRSFAALRQLLTSAQLGGAAIMALSDFNWSRITAKFNGLPAHKGNRQTIKLLADGMRKNKVTSRTAIRLGLIADHWSTIAGVQARYLMEVEAPMWSKRISDTILRISGLSHLTQSGRWGYGMGVMGYMADVSGKLFSQLDPLFQKHLKRYGINEGSWEIIRKTKLYDAGVDESTVAGKGITFLRPDDIHARADLTPELREDLVTRLLNMVINETQFAIPSTSARGRVMFAGRTQPGTAQGEVIASALMYKTFAITLGLTHLVRGFQQIGLKGKAKYLVPLLISATFMGALSYEIKQMAAGKQPTSPEKMGFRYWLNAMIYSGGLGIFGDFLFADNNRYGGSLAKTIVGPVVGLTSDLSRLTFGNAFELLSGEDTNFGSEFTNFVQRYTPGTSLWYMRLAYERLIIDTLEKLLNPNFSRDQRRKENALYKRTGQEYWWSPGELLPQ